MTHFDNIEKYDNEIPLHIAQYLLRKKATKITRALHKYRDRISLSGLDVGCGTGHHLNSLANHNTGWQLFGLDYSIKQLEWTREQYPGSKIINGSATTLPFEDQSLDFAYAVNSLHHLASKQDQQKAFDEISRVLKSQGIFIIHEMNTTNPILYLFMKYIFPKLRSIDNGDEIWLTKKQIKSYSSNKFRLVDVDYFTIIPFSFHQRLLPIFEYIDTIFDQSPFSYFGAHVMYVFQKMK